MTLSRLVARLSRMYPAIVHRQAAGVLHHRVDPVRGHIGPQIHPQEIGPLQGSHHRRRQLFRQPGTGRLVVFPHLLEKAAQPGLPAAESRLRRDIAHGGAVHHAEVPGKDIVLFPKLRVGDDHKGVFQPRQVKGLAGGSQGDHLPQLQALGGDVGMIPQDEILMDLVGEDAHPVLFTDAAERLQLVPPPDPAHRVVGRGEDEQLGAGAVQLAVQLVKIDGPAPRPVGAQVTGRELPPVVPDGVEEGVIDRGEHRHRIPRPGAQLHQPIDGRNDPRGKADPLPLQGQAVLLLLPAEEGVVIVLRHLVVAKGPVGRPGVDGQPHAGRALEVHVRHPQREEPFLPKLPESPVPFAAVGVLSIDVDERFAVHHKDPPFLLRLRGPGRSLVFSVPSVS